MMHENAEKWNVHFTNKARVLREPLGWLINFGRGEWFFIFW
jgi:hypothetical protein